MSKHQQYNALVDRKNGLDFLSPRQPTYWPTDPKKIPDLIDFGITKNISRQTLSVYVSHDLCSDHSAVIVTYHGPAHISKSPTISFHRPDWMKYRKYISAHIELIMFVWKYFL